MKTNIHGCVLASSVGHPLLEQSNWKGSSQTCEEALRYRSESRRPRVAATIDPPRRRRRRAEHSVGSGDRVGLRCRWQVARHSARRHWALGSPRSCNGALGFSRRHVVFRRAGPATILLILDPVGPTRGRRYGMAGRLPGSRIVTKDGRHPESRHNDRPSLSALLPGRRPRARRHLLPREVGPRRRQARS